MACPATFSRAQCLILISTLNSFQGLLKASSCSSSDVALVEVDGKCQSVDDKLNSTQSFHPGEGLWRESGAEAGGKEKERTVSEYDCLWAGGGGSRTDPSSPHSSPGPAAVVSTAGIREVMGRNISIPYSWWENEPGCGPEVCILQPTELLWYPTPSQRSTLYMEKSWERASRQEALYDQ